MPAVARLGDACTGHGCYPPRQNVEGSSNVFVNGIACHAEGDAWIPHGCGVCTPHGGSAGTTGKKVYVNGDEISTVGTPVDCGSTIAEGSSNVFAGG